jgi:glutaredoxin-like protein
MPLLDDNIRAEVKKEFSDLTGNVKLIVFTQEMDCQYCNETKALAEEVAELSDKIAVESYDLLVNKDKAAELKIDKAPAIAVLGEDKDYGIRFYGIPGGYEFSSLLEAIKLASSGDSGLSPESRKALSSLKKPVHIKVFITLSCPYCPLAVQASHRCAVESELVTAEMIEAQEFAELSNKYEVYAVPKVILNEDDYFEGALPEEEFVRRVVQAGS